MADGTLKRIGYAILIVFLVIAGFETCEAVLSARARDEAAEYRIKNDLRWKAQENINIELAAAIGAKLSAKDKAIIDHPSEDAN